MIAPARAAEEIVLQGTTLALPEASEGWTRKTLKDGVILQKAFPRSDAEKASGKTSVGQALIEIPQPVPATADNPFPVAFQAFAHSLKQTANDKPLTKGAGLTVNGHPIVYEQRCCGSRPGINHFTVGIAAPAAHQMLMLVMVALSNEEAQSARSDFERIVRSVRPRPNDRAFALEAAPGDHSLDGLYTTIETGIRPNVFGGTDFFSESRIMLFETSGLYSSEVPKGSLTLAEHCKATPADCETYRILGGGLLGGALQIELTSVESPLGILNTQTKTFQRTGEGIKIGDTDYRHVEPLPQGTPFEGRWSVLHASSGSMASSSGGVSSQHVLALARDGRFTRTGYASVMASNQAGDGHTSIASGSARPVERGRYSVEGYRLTLMGEDGRSETLSLFEPDRGSDGVLVINGSNYLKAK